MFNYTLSDLFKRREMIYFVIMISQTTFLPLLQKVNKLDIIKRINLLTLPK